MNKVTRKLVSYFILIFLFFFNGCSVVEYEIAHKVTKSIREQTVPVVETSYQVTEPVLRELVETEIRNTIDSSEIVLTSTVTKDEANQVVFEISTLKGSKLTIELEDDASISQVSATLIRFYIEVNEEGFSVWRRQDVSQKDPFMTLIRNVRSAASNNNIKKISDTVSTPYL